MFGKTLEYGFGFSGSVKFACELDCQPVARPSAFRGMLKVLVECWSLLSGSPVEVVRVEGKLPPWSRTIWPRVCPGSSLDPPHKTGALPDRRPSKGM